METRLQAVVKLEELKAKVIEVRDLFRDKTQTEFVIATIPTVMAVNESRRLLEELRLEGVPVRCVPPLCFPSKNGWGRAQWLGCVRFSSC